MKSVKRGAHVTDTQKHKAYVSPWKVYVSRRICVSEYSAGGKVKKNAAHKVIWDK